MYLKSIGCFCFYVKTKGDSMIYTYKECIEKYKTDYGIRKFLAAGYLKRVSRGVYSYAVFTMNSTFYYHGLTDTIPRSYYLMTDKDSTKIKDKRVCQDIVLKAISQSTLYRNVTIKGGVVMNNYVY